MSDGPLIVSSNPFDGIRSYCDGLISADPNKWKDILPWEFPQQAPRAVEDEFLRKFFSELQIDSRGGAHGDGLGFRFLKQVWYCIAMWNVDCKIPVIADSWIAQNQDLVGDANMVQHVCKEGAPLSAFGFGTKEVEMYGEKLLGWAIRNIQIKVRYLAGQQANSAVVSAEQRTSTATDATLASAAQVNDPSTSKCGPETTQQLVVTSSAIVPKVALHVPDMTPRATNSMPSTAQTEYFPDFSGTGGHPPGTLGQLPRGEHWSHHANAFHAPPEHPPGINQQSRPRGNSNNYNKRGGYNGGNNRHHQDRSNSQYYSPQYQGITPYNTTTPSIGNVPYYPTSYQFQNQQQTLHATHGGPGLSQEHVQGGPPPFGEYGNQMQQPMIQQSYGQPFPPQHAQQIAMAPHGFAPAPFQNQYFNNEHPMNDRSNERHDNRGFSELTRPFESEEHTSYKRGGKRRDSTVSRGNKSRGTHTSHVFRGKGSRGRNSFTDPRPPHEVFHHPDAQLKNSPRPIPRVNQFPADSYFANGDRRASMNSQTWRNKNERLHDNSVMGGRVASGPVFPTHGQMHSDAPFPPPGFGHSMSTYNDRNSGWMPNAPQASAPQQAGQPWVSEFVHDENDPRAQAYPRKLLTRNHIGMECGHVTKLIVFNVPQHITDVDLVELFKDCGKLDPTVTRSACRDRNGQETGGSNYHPFFENHMMAMKGLQLNHKTIRGTEMKIEVPSVYWNPDHRMYPGFNQHRYSGEQRNTGRVFGNTAVTPRGREYSGPPLQKNAVADQSFTSNPFSPADPEKHGSVDPTAKPPISDRMLREFKSGDSTPSVSEGTSTPKKQGRNKNKNKKNGPRVDPRSEALQAALSRHARAESASAKSDGSTATVVRSSGGPRGEGEKADTGGEAAVESEGTATVLAAENDGTANTVAVTETPPPVVDPERKVSVACDEAQTASEPRFSPVATMSGQMPKVLMPKAHEAAQTIIATKTEVEKIDDEAGSKGAPSTSFRGPQKTTKKATSSANEALTLDTAKQAPNDTCADLVLRIADITKESRSTQPDASPLSQRSDQADDSFHTARSSPPGSIDSRRKEDRGSEASTASAVTVIQASPTPNMLKSAPQDEKKIATLARNAVTDDKPMSPSSPSQSFKTTKKAPVPLSPKVKLTEPPKSYKNAADSGHGEVGAQRATSGGSALSIPPTPAFQTAPSTPALPEDGESYAETVKEVIHTGQDGKPVETAETPKTDAATKAAEAIKIAAATKAEDVAKAKAAEKAAKAEKAKGPAQTESFSLFSKKQTKPKKVKAVKGSMKGKPKGADRSFSTATSETLSRVVSGVSIPDTLKVASPTPASPSRARGTSAFDVDSLNSLLMDGAADADHGVQKDGLATAFDEAAKASRDAKNDSNTALDTAAVDHTACADPTTATIDNTAAIDSGVESAAEKTPSQSRSQSMTRGVVGYMMSKLGRGQMSQPSTSATHVGETVSTPASADMSRQGSQSTLEIKQVTSADTQYEDAVELVDDAPVVPTAQMVAPDLAAGSTEGKVRPFRESQDLGAGDGCRDSGDSGGRSAAVDHTDVGLGIDATGDAGIDVETKAKKKRKKSKKSTKIKQVAMDNEVDAPVIPMGPMGPDYMAELSHTPSSYQLTPQATPSGFMLNFTANSQSSPRVSHTPSKSLQSIPDSASGTSSQTIGRSSTGDAIAQDSPTRSTKIREAISKGSPHLLQESRIPRLLHRSKRITSFVRESPSESPPEQTEVEGNLLDDMIDMSMERKDQPPIFYLYAGPGKRGSELGWEDESAVLVEGKMQEMVERKSRSMSNAENVKPASPSPRKGG